ncbi:MAG: winged helix-turn-helix transcriptional regulator [Treponema sp.]|jgi:predicted transcriptional regulator|nr:winged helix-turn-helix transcriptional regulator [Treponema sp.]
MRTLKTSKEIVTVAKALSSENRIQILQLIAKNKDINYNELASALNITNGTVTHHMKILEEADLVEYKYAPGVRGSQKNCMIKDYQFMIDILSAPDPGHMYETEIPIGNFTQYSIAPTCGLANRTAVIGKIDDPRYFADPGVTEAAILWFTKGFVEYRIPNYLEKGQKLSELQLSFEISSEAPGYCDTWPSDIYFSVNGISLGFWTSPGDFGGEKGLLTPDWWDPNWNSYGLLKLLTINREGTFIDGGKISDTNVGNLAIEPGSTVLFRFSVPEDAKHVGGCTLFGKGFGNYNQNIKIRALFID